MKIYKWIFVILTLAQMVFTVVRFFLVKKIDRVMILSLTVYIACIIISIIAYEVEKYRKRRKEMIDDLP
ncbi:MAG TPA: hypothetical protein VNT20_22835 [Flavisolibacter sp.]|nr:hypothetical protein [Flavisolibacter sp.]